MTEIELKDLRIQEEVSLGGLSVAVEKVGDNKVFRPLTITENGTYDGGEEDGKFIGYTPVTVDIKPNPVPLTVTENGVYENEEGFSPVVVKVEARTIKKVLDHTKSMKSMFEGVQSLEDLTGLIEGDDTENVADFTNAFASCGNLHTVPTFSIKSAIWLPYVFMGCKSLKNAPKLQTANIQSMVYMFIHCSSLEVIPDYDVRSCGNFTKFVDSAINLREIWVKNIRASLQVGSGTTWGHLLTVESLIHLIYQLRDRGSLLTLTMGAVNLEKLANVYVRTVEITDEMRAEDDLIDEKLPFEVCESTDEGACLIKHYVSFKNWEIN